MEQNWFKYAKKLESKVKHLESVIEGGDCEACGGAGGRSSGKGSLETCSRCGGTGKITYK